MHELAQEIVGEELARLDIIGRDDGLSVYAAVDEYPCISIEFRPVGLTVNGVRYENACNRDMFGEDYSYVGEGEVERHPGATVTTLNVEYGGPGMPETYLSIEH